ncbi:MAG: SLC13 family permease [Stappiaceae bacterium]
MLSVSPRDAFVTNEDTAMNMAISTDHQQQNDTAETPCHRTQAMDLTIIATPFRKPVMAVALALCLSAGLWIMPQALSPDGRLALIVTVVSVIGWTLTRIPDSLVALAGAVSLVGLGVLEEKALYSSLGSEMIWLLVAAFIMAAILKASGLLERLVFGALRPLGTVRGLLHGLTIIIALTAFLVPSTSGRAALLMPVFLTLVDRLPDHRLVRPLALLFPTVILLSAGGSLIGAGAHFVAVDMIGTITGNRIGYFEWIWLALPFAFLSSLAGVWLIMLLFVPRDLFSEKLAFQTNPHGSFTVQQKRVALVVLGVIAAWMTIPIHGFDVAIVAIAGAAVLLSSAISSMKPKEVFRQVEVELLIFLAATLVIARALRDTGADIWLAQSAMDILPESMTGSLTFIVVVTALVALTAHLIINSRSARAAVLIPVFALPMAGFGHDVTLLILVTVLGTGFCQTMMASAKPVALFGNLDRDTFRQTDLMRLAVPLLPVIFVLLIGFALFLWPIQIAQNSNPDLPKATDNLILPASSIRHVSVIGENATGEKVSPQKQAAMPGALCSRDELATTMMALISEHRMWSAGWWHVWDRLRRDGYPVERKAVRAVYKEDNMVMLRDHSVELAKTVQNSASVDTARAACRTLSHTAAGVSIPVPRPKI